MPRVAASNGIRPEIRALSVIQLNVAVTPAEINKAVGTGDYAAKYISFLRKLGFDFTVTKDGKKVVSYILTKEPANAGTLRAAGPVVAKVVSKVAPVKKAAQPKALPKTTFNDVAKDIKKKLVNKRKDAFGNDALTGEVATYTMDDYEAPVSLRDLGVDTYI